MKVSVIIPTYKPQDYLWECIDSLCNQTMPHDEYEVIVVLNGEREPFESQIREYVSSHAEVNWDYVYQGMASVSAARNLGLSKAYLDEDSPKTVYRSDADTLQSRLAQIGSFIHQLLSECSDDDPRCAQLRRVFDEQYTVKDGKSVLRDKVTVKADSVQNPNAPAATYRDKNDQKVQGYVTNITETVEDGKPSIITSMQVETAVFADCHFLQEAVGNSERVTNVTVEDLYADGAYQSPDNRAFAEGHAGMRLKTGKMQGGNRWELIRHDEDGLTVVDKQTGNTYEAVKAVTNQGKRQRWRIPWANKTGWRYFEDKDIEAYRLRKQIESLPPEEQRRRNNVETAMFQYSTHTRNGKTRYRGLLKHRMQAYARCAWMNFRRVVIFQFEAFQRTIFALFEPFRGSLVCMMLIFPNNIQVRPFYCESQRIAV